MGEQGALVANGALVVLVAQVVQGVWVALEVLCEQGLKSVLYCDCCCESRALVALGVLEVLGVLGVLQVGSDWNGRLTD